MPLAAWRIGDQRPERVSRSKIPLERDLEDWIEADPNLVLEGLVIVGRQVGVTGGRLDLLGIDPAGRWVVLELKPGPLDSGAVGQALSYVANLHKWPADRLRSIAQSYLESRPNSDAARQLDAALPDDDASSPEFAAVVVGTGSNPGLEHLIEFHADHDVDIDVVNFEVFELADGGKILIREVAETAPAVGAEPVPEPERLKDVLAYAEENGHRAIFEDFLAAGTRLGLHARPYTVSVMFTPPTNKTRMLFTISTEEGASSLYTYSEAFEEFFPGISADQARRHLGADGYRELDQNSAAEFLSGLERLWTEAQVESPTSLDSE